MIDYVGMLKEFHDKYSHYQFHGDDIPHEVLDLRIKLINEEVNEELLPALEKLKHVNNYYDWHDTMIEIIDAVSDSLYVIFGTCISVGVPVDEAFTEVHRSNMTKSMMKDSKSIKGKTLKGPDWQPPELKAIFFDYLVKGPAGQRTRVKSPVTCAECHGTGCEVCNNLGWTNG
jgi:hypothetical protein